MRLQGDRAARVEDVGRTDEIARARRRAPRRARVSAHRVGCRGAIGLTIELEQREREMNDPWSRRAVDFEPVLLPFQLLESRGRPRGVADDARQNAQAESVGNIACGSRISRA